MSSLDSVINSLSATTMEDFIKRHPRGRKWVLQRELLVSRMLTVFWGMLALVISFFVDDIATTVLVAINKIGSLINGPVLGVFMLGILTKRANGSGACVGLLFGFITNICFWLYFPSISWLWWNVIGFIVTFGCGQLVSCYCGSRSFPIELLWSINNLKRLGIRWSDRWKGFMLMAWFFLILGFIVKGL